MAQIKLVWYNVLRGFHKKEQDGSFTFEPERLEAAKKIISSLKADILFIGEGDFNPKCKIKGEKIQTIDYQKMFNYPYVYYSDTDETSRKGEVILSKFKISAVNHTEGKNTHIRSSFVIDKKKVTIDVIHPYPTIPEQEKANFVGKIIDKKESPYVLLGDFNALSPKDKYKFSDLVEEFILARRSKALAEKEAEESLQALMLGRVIDSGLIDTYLECNKRYSGTLPTKAYTRANKKTGTIRIDYIFCSKEFKVVDSGVLKNELSEIASDHYPIYATLVF